MSFATLGARLQLNISDFSSKLSRASEQMSQFAKGLNDNYGRANAALTTHNLGLKDTARIVQGILVSQAFYRIAGSIQDATSALWEFNKQLDYAKVTYSALFGSTKLADDFMAALQEHSVNTIFDYQNLADASKKLLAYGIEYENLMFIMEGLTNLGAMSGDSAALDRIALALGQIYTKGKLGAEEMRQLANAYVPISDIIKERFNLSEEDMERVGDLNLPAAEVINAVVDYANEKFGSVGDAAMYTITGLENKIVDTLKVVGSEMMRPITTAYKSFLAYVSDGLEAIRTEFAAGGIGGIFEYLVPDEGAQTIIRQFVANIRNLFMSLVSVGVVVGQVFGNFAHVFATTFNIVTPLITGFINTLAYSLNAMLNTRTGATLLRIALVGAAGAFVVLRVQALASLVVTAVTKAIMNLSKALIVLATVVTKHPVLALFAGLAIALVGVSVSSENANKSISGLFDTLSGAAGGLSQGDVLQKIEQDIKNSSDAADQFNNRLENGATAADDLADGINGAGDAADKAAKKAAGLLSFDEVFKLNEPKDTNTGSGIDTSVLDDIGNLISGLGGLSDALIPDIPDFSEYIEDFTDGLFGGLKNGFAGKLAAAGLGGYIASNLLKAIGKLDASKFSPAALKIATTLAGALNGAFIGLGFDALASLLTDKLWVALEDAFKLKDGSAEQASLGATIGSVIGGAIGSVFGGVGGALIGSAIGHLAGGVVGLLWQEIAGALSNSVVGLGTGITSAISRAFIAGTGAPLTAALSSAFSSGGFRAAFGVLGSAIKNAGIKSIAKGGLIGIAVGFVVDGIAALLWNTLEQKFENADSDTAKVGQIIGSAIGTVIGAIIGGPVGALIGSAIGTFAGGLVGLFWEPIKEYFDPETNALSAFFVDTAKRIGNWATDTWNSLSGWCVDTYNSFTNWWKDTTHGFSDWWDETTSGFSEWYNNTKDSISNWWDETVATFSDWDSITSDTLNNWWESSTKGFSTWCGNTFGDLSKWYTDTITKFDKWWTDTTSGFVQWKDDTFSGIVQWTYDTYTEYTNWKNDVKELLFGWFDEAKKKVGDWCVDTAKEFGNWCTDTYNDFIDWAANVIHKFEKFDEDAKRVITGFTIAAFKSFSDWCKDTRNEIDGWFSGLVSDLETWWENAWDVTNWKSGWSHVKNWFSNMLTDIGEWFRGIKTSVSSWWDNLWDLDAPTVSGPNISGLYDVGASMLGHASGGIFNREHIARFAEGNRAEAVIPLENASAMQPFVDAISNGIVSSLGPIIATGSNSSNGLPPMYVGTLIADDRGIKQLYKKFELIQLQEEARKGLGTV